MWQNKDSLDLADIQGTLTELQRLCTSGDSFQQVDEARLG
jgi:predicted Zn-dependent protease